MRFGAIAVVCCTLSVLSTRAASADTVFTYNLNGSYSATSTLPAGTLSGTMTFNVTTNTVIATDIQASGFSSDFVHRLSVSVVGQILTIALENSDPTPIDLFLELDTFASVQSGTTTLIDPHSHFGSGTDGQPFTGTLAVASPVPGPTVGAGASSFALAALFLGWLVRRRGQQLV